MTQTLSVLYSEFFLIFAVGVRRTVPRDRTRDARTGVLPTWLGWVTFLIGVLSITPIGFFAFPLGALWVIVTSILLFQKGAPAAPAQTALPTT